MCFDNDYQAECYSSAIRKARKEHRCVGCSGTIEVGHLYKFGSGIFDGDPFTTKHCGICELTLWMIHVHELSHGCNWHESWIMEDEYLYSTAKDYGIPPRTTDDGQRFFEMKRQQQLNGE